MTENRMSCMRILIAGILTLSLILTFGCGDDDPTSPEPTSNRIYDSLVFRRGGGSTMSTGADWAICCGVWESGYIEDNTLKILIYDALGQESGFKLFILIDSVAENFSYGLPTDGAGIAPVSMFINDIPNADEFNSAQGGSLGSIVVNSISCGPPVVLDISIDATVASEVFGVQPVTVNGRFVCEIHSNPATFGCDFSF